MSVLAFSSLAWGTCFPHVPLFDAVKEPPGSLTHPPRAHGPEAGP